MSLFRIQIGHQVFAVVWPQCENYCFPAVVNVCVSFRYRTAWIITNAICAVRRQLCSYLL